MAQPKLIAVVLLALFGVAHCVPKKKGSNFSYALAAESGKDLPDISQELKKAMNETLSEEDRADAEKTFSFAKEFISKLEESEKQIADELLTAWDQVLHHPDSCNELSLGYMSTIYDSCTGNKNVTRTLLKATNSYANKCVTPKYIADMIKLRAGRIFEIDLDFVDDQFIADYWSKNPDHKEVVYVELKRLPGAITKAINRGREKKIKVPRTADQVRAYLNERLYKPCIEYVEAVGDVMGQMLKVSYFLGRGYGNFYETLDKETKRVFFRYELCHTINSFETSRWFGIEIPVSSRLTGLAAVGQEVAAWKSRIFDS